MFFPARKDKGEWGGQKRGAYKRHGWTEGRKSWGGFRSLSASGSFGQGVYRVRDGGRGGETGRVSGREQNGRCSGRWETERRMHRAAARASDRKRAAGKADGSK